MKKQEFKEKFLAHLKKLGINDDIAKHMTPKHFKFGALEIAQETPDPFHHFFPALGPDATALGQIFWYTLEGLDPETGESVGGWDLDELRSIQDWSVRYALQSADGFSEVASGQNSLASPQSL